MPSSLLLLSMMSFVFDSNKKRMETHGQKTFITNSLFAVKFDEGKGPCNYVQKPVFDLNLSIFRKSISAMLSYE